MKTNDLPISEKPADFWTGLLALLLIACIESWMWWRCGSDCFRAVAGQGLRWQAPGADISLALQ